MNEDEKLIREVLEQRPIKPGSFAAKIMKNLHGIDCSKETIYEDDPRILNINSRLNEARSKAMVVTVKSKNWERFTSWLRNPK